ncbi:Ras-related small GTP-binding family protein, putative [Theobroma cacao]|uniref:Ras-related small GTP-binding family protein, putative n=1 Tax=Theobroma cacao TaxID=3641 RepID=A0A061E912_THECC|nr:Ras-related small GTP-binding family protein, putative [Theobroma cacao]
MTQMCPKMVKLKLRLRVHRRLLTLRRCIRCFWDRILMCSLGKPIRYRVLPRSANASATATTTAVPSPSSASVDCSFSASRDVTLPACHHNHHDSKDSDLVPLKISLLGDSQIGKTSFLVKYIGDEKDELEAIQENGLNLMDKTFFVRGARISYSIWDVDGGQKSKDHIPLACKDSVAILFMFDLTSRCTLNSVISWYQQARKWNQTAIPILIGTKFDDFIQLPIDLQWTIASQARAYAKALSATLFFSSATYNINVNKIFKFITAKLFDLPWTVERNLTIGEPIIDF